MLYRELGSSGIVVSEIGFGAWGIGGTHGGSVGYGRTDDDESISALRRALDLGVTYFDTSDLYGFGHSETLLGRAFHSMRSRIVFGTKVGFMDAIGRQDFSPEHLRRALEESLRRLQTDYVDIYHLHNPVFDESFATHAAIATLERFKTEGKVRVTGVSLRSPADGHRAICQLGAQVLQVNFNMLDQRALESGLLAQCDAEGVGVICRTPLCFGFLSDKYSADAAFDSTDHRSRWSREQIGVWLDAAKAVRAVVPEGDSAVQVALRYCLSYPPISTVIPGMLTPRHVDENVTASVRGPLPDSARTTIEAMYRERNLFIVDKRPPQ